MEMTDVYWRLISYYLNLAASQKSIRARFAGEGMGWDGMGWNGWREGWRRKGRAGGGSEALRRQRAEPDKKKIKGENIPCLYFSVAESKPQLKAIYIPVKNVPTI